MSFAPYLYFSFVLVSLFSILEVTKNFKHSLLLKIQFIGLLTFASAINLFLFKGPLTEVELSIVRLLIDLMPMFVLNIALIIYAYKVPIWIFIAELSIGVIGGIFVAFFTSNSPNHFVQADTFHFYSIASTRNEYLKVFRILLLSGYFLFFVGFITKTTFFEQQKNQFFKPLRFWITLMILGFVLYIFENTLPIHVYTKGVYSTHVLPIYLMLGILYRPQSINAPWYQFDELSDINKAEISKDNFEAAFYTSEFYLKEKASIESLSVDLGSNKTMVTAFIKKNTGLGFADLINKTRVDYLVELLREGKHEDYTIEALAKMSGFGSRQTMYKAFAKFRNQSPSDFIDSLKH
jgi:AraC-like DNA-binding protein/drug/metabolite transporter (DMT)-like permease